jgi:hypothetical protein
MAEQNYSNHVRWVPAFHFFVVPVLLINVGVQLYWWVKLEFAPAKFFSVLVALALLVGFVSARIMALRVQDRVIRMEERQRMSRLLPEDLQPRIGEFTMGQLVALRFASDEELSTLARKVLNDKLTQRKIIKQMVQHWRADNLRA